MEWVHYSNCSHTQAPDVRNPLMHSLSTPQTKCLKNFLRQVGPNWIYLYVLLISIDVSVMWVYIEFQMWHFPARLMGGICFGLSPACWVRTFSALCGFALVLVDHQDYTYPRVSFCPGSLSILIREIGTG